MERYYQVARCFRDEDSRADRQPEFTQLDVEMSFVEEKDILAMIERHATPASGRTVYGKELKTPFPRITFDDAMPSYGTDAPDVRFGLELDRRHRERQVRQLRDLPEDPEEEGDHRLHEPQVAHWSRRRSWTRTSDASEVDRLIEWAKQQGMGGLTWMRMTEEGLQSTS